PGPPRRRVTPPRRCLVLGGRPDLSGLRPRRDRGESRSAGVLAQVLSATLLAFTRTRSVRDPLPDTASDSPEEALAVLAGIDHLRSSLSAMDAAWQVAAEQRIRRDDARRGLPASRQGAGATGEIALARRI